MKTNQIKAIGNFLATYHSDLLYIKNFKLYKQKNITFEDFTAKGNHSFYDFLVEFRVARNFEKGKVGQLLNLTINWINESSQNDVDGFTQFLKSDSITRGNTATSLASKILFLNNPWVILPMDALARNSLKQKTNLYFDYTLLLEEFKTRKKVEIDNCLASVDSFSIIIEEDFKDSIENLSAIRYNRLLDKLLWTQVN